MKKILSVMLVCAIFVGTMLTLVSCGGALSGKYEGDIFDLEFSGDEVTVSVPKVEDTLTGTYEIKEKDDGSKTISFDFVEEKDNQVYKFIDVLLGADLDFEEDGDTITIGKIFKSKFTKK